MITITETIETKKHEDGFSYDLHKRQSTNEGLEIWAEVYPRDSGPSRLKEGFSKTYWVKVENKHYKLVGEEVVVAEVDPTAEEMIERINTLVQKFIDKGVHVFMINSTCDECSEDGIETYLFASGHGMFDAGCGMAGEYILAFCNLNDDEKVVSAKNPQVSSAYIKDIIRSLIVHYALQLENIEEWINAEVPQQV
jgi:hypothetical protein